MKKIIVVVVFLFSVFGFCQDTISTSQVKDFIGKEVVLMGKVASFKLAAEGKYTTYINVDEPFPKNIFTVVVSNKFLETQNLKLDDSKGKQIIVRGTIEIYDKDPKKIPQIYNPSFIKIK